MTTTINASTSSGLVNTADTSGILQLQTASTAALTIDASQNVGIGTASPISKFNVKQPNNTSIGSLLGVSSSADDSTLYIGYRSDIGGMIMSPTYASTGSYQPLIFRTSDTNRMTIDTSGNVLIATTNAITGITGAQLTASNTSENPAYINIFRDDTTIGNGQFLGYLQFCGRDATSSLGTAHAYVGAVAEADHGAGDNATAITFGTTPDNSSSMAERMRIDSSGNVLVGTTVQSASEKFNATSSSTEVARFENSSNTSGYNGIRSNIGSGGNNTSTYHFRGETRGVANWYLYGNGTTSYSSDIRLKKNVQTARGYLEDLNKLRVVKYQWKGDNPDCQQVELGLIAQEVEEVFPNLIQEHEIEGVGDIKNIKQSVLPFMMLKAIQELKAINDTQAETINALTARIVALEGK